MALVHFIWPVMTKKKFFFSLPLSKVDKLFGHVSMYATPYPISWKIFIFDSEPSYTNKLLESRWVQIAPLSQLIYFYTATKETKFYNQAGVIESF